MINLEKSKQELENCCINLAKTNDISLDNYRGHCPLYFCDRSSDCNASGQNCCIWYQGFVFLYQA